MNVEEEFAKFCIAEGIRIGGQYSLDIRPAFEAALSIGREAGFAAGTNTKQNEASDNKFYLDQIRDRMLALYGMGPDCTWFDIAGMAENAMSQLNAMRDAMTQFCQRVDKGEVRSVRTYALFVDLLAGNGGGRPVTLPGRTSVDSEALRRVLAALVHAPHLIRELQHTREPATLFPNNPINILLRDYQEHKA